MKTKNFRKRSSDVEVEGEDEEKASILSLEEVKFLQKQREKKSGIPAILVSPHSASDASGGAVVTSPSGLARKVKDKGEGDAEKDDLVLQDTFAQETAVVVEDPNMLKYIEQELARKRGKNLAISDEQVENDIKHAEDELYNIPEHLKVKRKRGSGENTTQWTTGIAEIQLPIEYKLRNIEETEAAKKLLQEKRMMGRGKGDASGKSGNEDKNAEEYGSESRHSGNRRQAATDEFMLERFRKRERMRHTRR